MMACEETELMGEDTRLARGRAAVTPGCSRVLPLRPGVVALSFCAAIAIGIDVRAQELVQSIEGRTVRFVLPDGYCALSRKNAVEAEWYDGQEQANVGTNRLALLFAECKELAQLRKNAAYRVRRHGSYLLPFSK